MMSSFSNLYCTDRPRSIAGGCSTEFNTRVIPDVDPSAETITRIDHAGLFVLRMAGSFLQMSSYALFNHPSIFLTRQFMITVVITRMEYVRLSTLISIPAHRHLMPSYFLTAGVLVMDGE